MKGKTTSIIVVSIIGVIVLIIFKNRIEKLIKNIKDAQAKRAEAKLLDQLGMTLSHSKDWYNGLATELYQAVSWSYLNPNCDESSTQKALTKIENDRDYVELAIAFGVRDTYNMETYVQSCLNPTEKNWVNQIWSNKGITRRI